jgi:phage tail sheath protein FI
MVVTEAPGADHAIARMPASACAFVGRTLRGPVNQPVAVRSFAEFQQVFGGLWQPSPLPYAVEQFFENGGRRAVVVRVCNGGAPSTITLPCGVEALTLEALSPGSREALRASVDYDNVGANEDDRFNLVVQRVRSAGSEHIEDQEIFRRLSIVPGTTRFVSNALQESTLVRVRGAVPAVRPDRTYRAGARHPIGYIGSNPDGDDGDALTDYDLIGSEQRGTGLFALHASDDVHFLCIPPPARDRDVGPSVLVVAARVCQDLRAMLIVDPPAAWTTCDDALRGLRELDLQTDHALMCFPRVLAFDRLRGRYETFANGGAVAGVLARMDEQRSPWHPGPDDELLLRPGTRAALVLTDAERSRLAAHGINPLQSLRTAGERRLSLRTLAGGTGRSADSSLLTSRRRTLLVMGSIERGTRWAVFDAGDRNVWYKITRQVQDFLRPLAEAGLFGAGDAADACYVVCDDRVNTAHDMNEGCVNLLVGLRSGRAGEYFSFMVSHSNAGSRVRPARANRLPAGTRMTVGDRAEEVAVDDTQRQRTLAQALFGYYTEPRPAPAAPQSS